MKKDPAEELEYWKRKAFAAERMRFEKNKSELNSARSEISLLAAGVAHEFNNILGAVDGHAEWALSTQKTEDMREALEVARIACARSAQITRALQGLSQVNEESFEFFDAETLLREIEKLFSAEFKLQQISFERIFSIGENKKLYINASRITEVLVNLIRNSMDAMSHIDIESRKIQLTVLEKDRSIVFALEDNGPGISEEFKELIFQPFFTTKGVLKLVKSSDQDVTSVAENVGSPANPVSSHSDRSGGSGLGLYLSRAIAREHSGNLELVPCQSLGGARFELSLPEAS